MKITTKGRYALRLMVHLAQNSSRDRISLKDIAVGEDISMKYLEQIVPYLAKENLVHSTRGARGGYSLTKSPEEYSVGEIIEAVEGKVCLVDCTHGNENCSRYDECHTSALWSGLSNEIRNYLNDFPLSNLLVQEEEDIKCKMGEAPHIL